MEKKYCPRILIIDDNAKSLINYLEVTLDCDYSYMNPKGVSKYIDFIGIDVFQEKYNIIIFDGTYEYDEITTVDVFEKIINKSGEHHSNMKILLGEDLLKYYSNQDNFKLYELIQRIRKLPHIIYGARPKHEVVKNYIESNLKKQGFENFQKLPFFFDESNLNNFKEVFEQIKTLYNYVVELQIIIIDRIEKKDFNLSRKTNELTYLEMEKLLLHDMIQINFAKNIITEIFNKQGSFIFNNKSSDNNKDLNNLNFNMIELDNMFEEQYKSIEKIKLLLMELVKFECEESRLIRNVYNDESVFNSIDKMKVKRKK